MDEGYMDPKINPCECTARRSDLCIPSAHKKLDACDIARIVRREGHGSFGDFCRLSHATDVVPQPNAAGPKQPQRAWSSG